MKTLICVVTYEAEKHIHDTLSRLPAEVWNSVDYHVLVSDDGSTDNTLEIAKTTLSTYGKQYTLIAIEHNVGYGGNQKLCYQFALENKFDSVILLHGDGQYAPELVPQFRQYMLDGADVVLGSRMLSRSGAMKGGMPLYKFLGNRILTRIQNKLCGSNISEFHTGYRGYRATFLKRIQFELNADEFHFDTEILIQAFHLRAKIVEFSIPTHYGSEICRVPTISYTMNVLLESFRYRMQVFGLLTSLKYRHSSTSVYEDRTDDPYSVNSAVLSILSETQGSNVEKKHKILDIGCGQGYLAKQLAAMAFNVTTIDKFERTTSPGETHVIMDLDLDCWAIDISQYDTVLALDIIEHLNSPERFLLNLKNSIQSNHMPLVYLSTPNVAFFLLRLGLLFGRFSYADRGILDISHKRLFTSSTLKKLLRETGYEIERKISIGAPVLPFSQNKLFRALAWVSKALARLLPRIFAFQFLIIAKPKFTTHRILKNTKIQNKLH